MKDLPEGEGGPIGSGDPAKCFELAIEKGYKYVGMHDDLCWGGHEFLISKR